ncbi:hypothetical protein [Streptomyces sp. NPDC057854]|uniref:hypothetical protein n=1 Tax=unclassified Streptomyces TaxID=2593676 RepID=UPI0036B309B6
MLLRRTASALLVLLAGTAGCLPATGHRSAPSVPPSAQVVAGPPAGDEARRLRLPYDAYELSTNDTFLIESAVDVLMRACMRRHGLDWTLLPRADDAEPPNRRRYGLIESAIAERYGYHLPPEPPGTARRQAADRNRAATLSPHEHRIAYGESGDSGGCWKGAYDRLREGLLRSDHGLLNRLTLESFDASLEHVAVRRAFDSWSSCMRRAGFDHARPLAAAGDPRWARTPRPGPLELRTAMADVRCKQQTGLVTTWAAVETRLQTGFVRAHAKEFEALKAAKEQWLANARRVLA